MEDWKAAIDFVANNDIGVDSARIALWGTSYSGGHVLVSAAELQHQSVKCILSQVPHLDGGIASKIGMQKRGVFGTLRLAYAGIADSLRGLLGLSPFYIKIAGVPGELAFMMLDEADLNSYSKKIPEKPAGGWENMAPARLALSVRFYSPISYVDSINVPTLFVAATKDDVTPLEPIRKAAQTVGTNAEIFERDTTHFQLYLPGEFEAVIRKSIDFFMKHLLN